MNSANLIAKLRNPTAYDHKVGEVGVTQTHISYVLLAGDYAYKIKKPVNFGFVDYSTLERRRQMCDQEVRLNRRLCDAVYLQVVAVTQDHSGEVRIGGKGAVVEYAVQMKRVPDERTMPALLASSQFTPLHLRGLALRLAQFHDGAATGNHISSFGTSEVISRNWDENFQEIERHVGISIERTDLQELRHYVVRFLERNTRLLVARSITGRIRDCHGDLRADSVVIWPDDSICVMDCIEFNERLRFGDVASDVAFLAMDLEYRGYPGLSDAFVSAYLDHTDDETLTSVLNFYRAYRACVRGKVEGILSDDSEVPPFDRQRAGDRAGRYLRLATEFTQERPPSLIITVGLSGTGKSWLASPLAGRLAAALIRSDYVRRELTNSATPAAFEQGAYSLHERERVYDVMFERATHYLEAGQSVVLDAAFLSRHLRSRARTIASDFGVRFLAIEVVADELRVRERLAARAVVAGVSDARWDTYLAQRDQFEAVEELPMSERVTLDSSNALDALVASALSVLDAQLLRHT